MSLSREIKGNERVEAAKLKPITSMLSRAELEIRTGAAEVRDRNEASSVSQFASKLITRSPEFKASLGNEVAKELLKGLANLKEKGQERGI